MGSGRREDIHPVLLSQQDARCGGLLQTPDLVELKKKPTKAPVNALGPDTRYELLCDTFGGKGWYADVS